MPSRYDGEAKVISLGEGAAIFDPVPLETVYLDAAETREVRQGEDKAVASLSEFGL